MSIYCRIVTHVRVCLLKLLLPFTKYNMQECGMFRFERRFAPEHFVLICICAEQFFFSGEMDTRGNLLLFFYGKGNCDACLFLVILRCEKKFEFSMADLGCLDTLFRFLDPRNILQIPFRSSYK